jgi:membrane protein DedA with SNARE-associated domain
VADAEVVGELSLEGRHLRTEDVAPGPDDLIELLGEPGQVAIQAAGEEGDGHGGPLPYSARMLLLSSITDPIVEVAVDVVDAMGLAGVFVLMLLESACIPVPSEATMLFAGFNVANGEYSLFAAVAVGSIANLVGSWVAYAVGWYGRVDVLERHGRKLHIKKSHLEWADRWFERHGDATVFFTRMLPIIRTFISLPAGVARMPFWRFSALTLAGCVPWVLMLTFIGQQAGDNWEKWKDSLHYVDYAVAALIVGGIAYLIVRRRRSGPPGETATETA